MLLGAALANSIPGAAAAVGDGIATAGAGVSTGSTIRTFGTVDEEVANLAAPSGIGRLSLQPGP